MAHHPGGRAGDLWLELVERPETENDARDGGAQVDHARSRPAWPERGRTRSGTGHADREGNADDDGDECDDDRPVHLPQRPVVIGLVERVVKPVVVKYLNPMVRSAGKPRRSRKNPMRNRIMKTVNPDARATPRKILSSRDRSFGTEMGRRYLARGVAKDVSRSSQTLRTAVGLASASAPNQASDRTLPDMGVGVN